MRVVIAGRPNVGKSSLLNALARNERAIVTEIPGTTRDVIEETIDIGGVPVVVTDTAGLRAAGDAAEKIGIERARKSSAAADLLLLVLDRSRPYREPPLNPVADQRVLVVVNKIDLDNAWTIENLKDLRPYGQQIEVSATSGEGIEDLEQVIVGFTTADRSDSTPPLTNDRQHAAVAQVEKSLVEAGSAAVRGAPADIIAVDVQLAIDHLGTVTGTLTTEDILDRVFSEFCIGK